jgi:four helix bundle protein
MTELRSLPTDIERRRIVSYRDLLVWSRAMDLVEVCYKISARFPQSELYGLANQLRRAAVSIPANIAEGHGRKNLGEYIQHLSIANGSLKEVETHLLISHRLKYIEKSDVAAAFEVCEQVGKMLAGLRNKLRQRKLTSV